MSKTHIEKAKDILSFNKVTVAHSGANPKLLIDNPDN